MSPEQIKSKLPPPLVGPKVMPDAESSPHVRIELNCICGAVLESATYLNSGLVKLVVFPCRRCVGRKQ
jgi:hypothetical protein